MDNLLPTKIANLFCTIRSKQCVFSTFIDAGLRLHFIQLKTTLSVPKIKEEIMQAYRTHLRQTLTLAVNRKTSNATETFDIFCAIVAHI